MNEVPPTVLIEGSDAAVEADRIRAGEAWTVTAVAGLQFHGYAEAGLDGQPVLPRAGQRLGLVRAPDNCWDENAVEVWLGNSTRLGHLPAGLASNVAGSLDAGRQLRAYCADPGDGTAWSVRALLVGETLADDPPPEEPTENARYVPALVDDTDEIPF